MSYGFMAGKPIAALAVSHGTSELWKREQASRAVAGDATQ
jgi:hypothetical protein